MIDVSIVVPVYNVEAYLEKCLNSLINQTYKNLHIIVVNDGSPDNSQKIIDQFTAKYPDRITALTKPNGGLGDARNFGLAAVNTEYVAFVDSDDYVHPEYINKMVTLAKQKNADLVFCGHYKVFEDDTLQEVSIGFTGHSISENPTIMFDNHSAWNKLCKTSLFKANSIEYPVGVWYEDLLPGILLTANARHIEKVAMPLYYYLIREGSISNSFNPKIFDYYKVIDSVKDVLYKRFPNEIEFIATRELAINLPRIFMRYAAPFSEIKKSMAYLNSSFLHWYNNKYIKKCFSLKDRIRLFTMKYSLYAITYVLVYIKNRILGSKTI